MANVVYTSIFGAFDKLKDPTVCSDDIDYICFTDNENIHSNIWDIRIVGRYKDPVRSAKRFKLGPHVFLKEYEYSLWVDGNMILKVVPDIEGLLDGKTIALARHPHRNCVYAEGITCMNLGMDKENRIGMQLKNYFRNGHPENAGLYMCGLIPRKHNDEKLAELSETWWYHVCTKSSRDQISFPVAFRDYPVGDISHETWREVVALSNHSSTLC